MDYKKYSDLPSYEETPFDVLDGVSAGREVRFGNYKTVSVEGKEFVGREMNVGNPDEDPKYTDSLPYLKVFLPNMIPVEEMDSAELKVFGYMWKRVTRGSDIVFLPIDELMGITKYKTPKPLYDAIKNLCNRKIIARRAGAVKHAYFINPNLLFNGARTGLINKPGREAFKASLHPFKKQVTPNDNFNGA